MKLNYKTFNIIYNLNIKMFFKFLYNIYIYYKIL